MNTSKQRIIAITIFVILTLVSTIWIFMILKDRYSNKDFNKQNTDEITKSEPLKSGEENIESSNNAQTEVLDNSNKIVLPPATEKEPFIKIERKDCLDNCIRFTKDSELTYCKQSCGLVQSQDNSNDCTDKIDLNKDYCIKDLAIEAMDFEICEKISDKGIKKTCIARITEELLIKQIQNSPPLPE